MSGSTKIALFGGSFDPIHLGHTLLAQAALDDAGIDRVVFIPCRKNPLKTWAPKASDEDRLVMIELAIADMDKVEVSRIELDRIEPSFSWLTVEEFCREEPEAQLFWILGTDQWGRDRKMGAPRIFGRAADVFSFSAWG